MAAAPASVPEVTAYTAPESTDEVQQSSLDALVSRMQAGSPSPRDLVSAVIGRQLIRLPPSANPTTCSGSAPPPDAFAMSGLKSISYEIGYAQIVGMAAELTSEDDRVRTRGCMLFSQVRRPPRKHRHIS